MMADSDLFEGALREAFAQEFAFALDHCVLVGLGAGQPEGVVAAPCTISVAKETGQAAATIVAANITNMHDRLVADCRPGAAWFVNPDSDPQLRNLALVVGTAGGADQVEGDFHLVIAAEIGLPPRPSALVRAQISWTLHRPISPGSCR